jgi:hypothetical protein
MASPAKMRFDPVDVVEVERVKRHVLCFARMIAVQFPKPSGADGVSFAANAINSIPASKHQYLVTRAMQGHEVPLLDVLQLVDVDDGGMEWVNGTDDELGARERELGRDMTLKHFWDLRQAGLLFVDVAMSFPKEFHANKFLCPRCGSAGDPTNGAPIRTAGFAPGLFAKAEPSGRLHLIKQRRYQHVNCPQAVAAAIFDGEARVVASGGSDESSAEHSKRTPSSYFLAWDPKLVETCYSEKAKQHYESYFGASGATPVVREITVPVPDILRNDASSGTNRTPVQLWGQPMFAKGW